MLDLTTTGELVVGTNAKLILRNTLVNNVHNNNIRCVDSTGTIVLQVVLGNGGAFQAEFFVHALFNSPSRTFNPTIRVIGQVSAPFTSRERIPKIKKLESQTEIPIPDLIVPIQAFQQYCVEPFSESDTTVLHFADQAVSTHRKLGSQVLIGIGWDLSYKFNNMVELNIGSEHAIAGKNVPKHHEVFASVVAVF